MLMNKKRTDLSVTEKLHLTDRYDLSILPQSDVAAKLRVPQSSP
jgi:hypothetical protein